MLWIKAFHLVFIVTWFSGLFYLPRLFVYHSMAEDQISIDRFKIMERKLYFGIVLPGAVIATGLGVWLLVLNVSGYMKMGWMHAKLGLVAVLWIYHFMCYAYYKKFKADRNVRSHVFFRWFNEFPVLLLIGIVILAIVKPIF